MRLLIKRTHYEWVDAEPHQLCTIREAVEISGLSYQGIASAIDRGKLDELVDPDKAGAIRDRRWLLRKQVEALATKHKT